MSCVHYKFKSSLEYQSVTFDGIHISLGDLKKAIINQKRMKSGEFDLEITNAQTGEVYKTEDELIPKNSSVIVSRVPVKATTVSNTQKAWEAFKEKCAKAIKQEREQEQLSLEKLKETPDLANAKGSEMDKIKAMIDQSTRDFDPSNYRGKHPIGPPPPGYHCHRCGTPGHYIQNCSAKLDDSKLIVEPRFKRSTGIPASFLTLTDDPTQPGALLTHTGQFAVPTIDAAAYAQGKKERPPFLPDPVDEEPKPQRPPVPKELLCSLCNNLLTDAVLIPCCGISYCDECIRTTLLDTDDRQCPACYKTDVSPDNLIANVQLRTAVVNFLNETGYTAAMFKKKEAPAVIAAAPLHTQTPPSKSSTPTMSQMEEARFEMERSQQHYKDGSPSNSMSSRRSRSEQRGRPLTVLGPSGNNSPSDHNSRPHRPYRERFPPRSSSSYSQHHHQRSWPERGSYSGSQGVKTEPQLPRTSALPPLISTAPPFTPAPPLLPSPGFPPRPFHPVPQPPPPAGPLNGYITGVTAPTSTFPPVGLHPFTAPPPSVVPPPVAPYAPPPFVGPAVPGVANHPPPLLAPLTEQEFYREKQRLMEKESSKTDVYEEFANFLKRTTKSNRPRSRSGSPLPNSTARRRSRSYSRSRSRSPSPSRSFRSSRSSPKHSRSPRSRSPRPHTPRSRTSGSPSYSSVRSRSRGRPRTRSRSRTPLRSSSRSPRTRGGKRYRSRSYSRSPNYRGSPRRSRSRSRVRGRSPPRRGYRSPSRSRSRSRSPSTRYSRSSSRSPRRRRSPMRFGRKRSSPSLSRSRSRSPFKEPLGAPTRPNWHNYRSPPPTANRNFPPQNLGPRYQPPGGPSGPFPNGPVFNFPGQVPVQRPSYFGGDFFPPQFPNQTRHPGPIPLMQIMPHGPRPPFDRQYYDNRGGPLPFGGPGPNSPPRAKSPFRSRMPGERRPDNRRDVRNRNTGERWEFGRRDGQDRRDVVQRREAASGDRREGGMKRKTDMGNAAAAPGGASANAGQATETRLKKVRKVKKRLVDGKKENKEGPSEKEGTIKKKGERVSSKSRHSSGASQDKLQERKVVVGQETPDASKPSKPSAEKTTPPPSTSAKDIGNSERQVVKADTSRELPRKVVSAADLPTKPQVAASNPPVVEVKTAVPSQNSSESAPDETSSSNTKLKKKKIRVKNPVATVTAAASAAAASVNAASFNAASFNAASVNAASVNAASGKVDDNQKKLMRLKRFQSDSGSSKGASPPKKMNREPTPPGLGKPMDLRLGEPRHRDGPDYDLPELSKWERDDVSRSPTENFNPRRKVVEKKPLPRSVIEKAESVLANKPIKPSVKPTTGGASPAKPARRVYVEENGSPKCTESEDKKGSSAMQITVSKTQRRVSESRHTHTSDRQHQDADVRRVAKSDHHKQVAPESERRRHHLSSADTARKSVIDSDHHRRAVSSADHQKKVSSDSERSKRTSLEPDPRKRADNSSEHHRRADSSDHQRRGDNSSDYQKRGDNRSDHQKRSDGSSDRHRHKTSTSDLHRRGEDSRLMSESVSHDKSSHSHSSRETKKTDWVSSSSKPAVETGKGKAEEKAPAPKEEKVQSSDSASAEDSQKPKETKSYLFDRKESMMDEATFEPDYDEQSGSESSVEETTTAGEQVSTLSSGTDRSSASPSKRGVQSQDLSSGHHKKSKKKHKHKSKHKHKHKKRKHKKNKGKVVESEDV